MITHELTVTHRHGLHAAACARLVQTLSGFKCSAKLAARGREIDAKSIMGVMMLAATQGSQLTLRVEGEDEAAAAEAVLRLFALGFDEAEPAHS